MRGASAIDAIVQKFRGAPVRVFVVWEPVVWTDAFRPKDAALARKLPDPRATHYWDPKRSLSKEILEAPWTRRYVVRGGPQGIVWDWVACYPQGALWLSHFPEPSQQGFPVVDADDRVRDWLSRVAAAPRAQTLSGVRGFVIRAIQAAPAPASAEPWPPRPTVEYGTLEEARDSVGAMVTRCVGPLGAKRRMTRERVTFEYHYVVAQAQGWAFHVVTDTTDCPDGVIERALTAQGWATHVGYSADGDDGTTMGFFTQKYFCFLEGRWDGGDPTDSTYVPIPGCRITVTVVPRREDDVPAP